MMLANIFEISSASFNKPFTLFFSQSIVSLTKQSQYFVSLADFKAIIKNFCQSFLELPALPSTTFAPMEVTLLINWSNIEKYSLSYLHSFIKEITAFEKKKQR